MQCWMFKKNTNAGYSIKFNTSEVKKNHHIFVRPMTQAWFVLNAGMSVETDIHLQGLINAVRKKLVLDLRKKAKTLYLMRYV